MSVVAGFMVPHPPLIVPEIGRGSENAVEETINSYKYVAKKIAELKPDTIVLSSPHTVMYGDYFHISPGTDASGSFASFGAAGVKMEVNYDTRFVASLCEEAAVKGIDAGILGERDKKLDHGTMVPLYFIRQEYTDFQLVRIGLSGLPMEEHYKLGMAVAKVADDLNRRVVYIASGDLSHKLQETGPYGFDPAGPRYDERIMDVMGRGAFDELFAFDEHFLDKAAECGHRSFVMMSGCFDKTNVTIEKLSHQDVTGVGYGICCYYVDSDEVNNDRAFLNIWREKEEIRRQEARAKEDAFVRLARKSLETYIVTGEKVDCNAAVESLRGEVPDEQIEELLESQAGAFVSLHKQGQLRGCIGTIAPVRDSVAEEIVANAVSAAVHDNRFSPVSKDELNLIEYSVDVLSPAEPIDSEDELDVKRYGVIVTKGYKRGLLLPNLDGVDTVEEQLAIAKRKAGLRSDEEGCSLERFEVVRHY